MSRFTLKEYRNFTKLIYDITWKSATYKNKDKIS